MRGAVQAVAQSPTTTTSESVTVAEPGAVRPRDQVWVVDCRAAVAGASGDALRHMKYAVHRATTGWSAMSQKQFQTTAEPSLATCILVLGNGYTASQTQAMGLTAYRRLVAGLPPERAVRFVVWLWPSDRTDAGPIKDLRIKAGRTGQAAYCLARWLDELDSPGPVSLLGTSFGARIVMEALELRAGGRVGSLQLPGAGSIVRPKVDVVLLSAAIDNDWLLPGRRLDRSLSQVNRLLLVNNSGDGVLKRYHWLYGPRSRAAALGTTGLASNRLGPSADKITQLDAAPVIGRQHGCGPYFDSPRLVASMQGHLFADRPAAAPPFDVPPVEGRSIPIASKGRGDVRPSSKSTSQLSNSSSSRRPEGGLKSQ